MTTSSALAVRADQTDWTQAQRAALVQLGIDEAEPGDAQVFLHYAQRTGLDPWARQIYMIGRWDARAGKKRWTIQASIDGLRIVAQRSGEYAGQVGPEWAGEDGVWRDLWLSKKPPLAARVGVLRKGFTEPLYGVAHLSEYMPTNRDGNPMGLWGSMPAVMLAKCAEALALRKAFPMDLSGLYTAEEMAQADVPEVPQVAPRAAQEPAPVEGWREAVEATTDLEELRDLYRTLTGVLTGAELDEAKAALTARAEVLSGPPDDVVDAEVVEDGAA